MYEVADLYRMAWKAVSGIQGEQQEEAVQEAVASAWEVGQRVGDVAGVKALQYQTLTGKVKNWIRREAKHSHLSLSVPVGEDGDLLSDLVADTRDMEDTHARQWAMVAYLLDELSGDEQTVVRGFMNGLSGAEVARRTGMSEAGVSRVKAKAVKALRRRVAQLVA